MFHAPKSAAYCESNDPVEASDTFCFKLKIFYKFQDFTLSILFVFISEI